jgi:hypothetical protein
MKSGKQQRGITLLGLLMVLMIFGFFAFIAMRLFPVYSENHSVTSAMKSLQGEPGIATKTPEEIRLMLDRKFNIGYVDSVKPQNIKVTRSGTGYTLNIKYEVRKPMAYNIDFVATFDKTVELARQGNTD